MTTLNKFASLAMQMSQQADPGDIGGGLLGYLHEMAQASGVGAKRGYLGDQKIKSLRRMHA